ncbi:hypothetical protein CAPTEDRAFT_201441 [Capitella teleta]|uniref:IPT/TIG domain-containing protein n=1 Tax=Capitella teleta TaxID=283909 RepID=R7T8X0_CAPTE|nr:hypothetical protein CAPTEDRAFT_201441 [Capitella teleta]|eukprot:ELT87444.1 hypothetical protein CAPTEDRAFT_201441 [Capitella teleta]
MFILFRGGTLLTVIGSYFDDVEDLRLTLRQLAGSVNSSRGMHVFPSVNYGPLECSVLSAKKMICITPALRLRSLEEFGSFEAEYQFGLTWDTRGHTLPPFPDNGGIHPSPPTRAPDVSFQLTVVELASIEEHQWSPYDQLTEEPLKIKVAWGAFQQEAEIYVGGTTANVTKRYHNLILFFPPDEKQIITSERHACRASAHVVEVRAGNTNRHVGCLQYAAGGDDLPSMLIAIAVSGAAVVLLVIALAITSCVVWGRKSSTEQSS